MIRKTLILSALLLLSAINLQAGDNMRLMRFPDINNNQIVFVYAGDIWTVNSEGGAAMRLTSHKGYELFPKISPDGEWIAFSAEYSGSRQIWVMPSKGGAARQLTYYNSVGMMPPRGGFDNIVLGWTNDSKKVLFRSNRTSFGDRNGKYFLVDIDGGFEEELPIKNGGIGKLSPNDDEICFTPVDREFRSWKRYKGGRATDLWIYNFKKNSSIQITDFKGSDQYPNWYKNYIYYASDRDLKFNIWRYNIENKTHEQVTFHKDFDVLTPSGNNGKLIYDCGGYLYVIDLETNKERQIQININYDNPNLAQYFKNVKDNIHSATLSPSGKVALFDARGDIFSVPAKNGNITNITNSQGIRDIYPLWSPSGKQIAYYSDKTGEYELYLIDNKENAVAKQITSNSKAWKYMAAWSPNSKYLVYSDRTLQLWLVEANSGKLTRIDNATYSEIRDYSFSPDSKWIVYTKDSDNSQSAIWVYNIKDKTNHQLTDAMFSDQNPVFSNDGKFIFFVSNRDFNIAFSSYEFNYLYNNSAKIYALALQNDGTKLYKEPFDFEPFEETLKSNDKKNDSAKNDSINVVIDFENINNRIEALPLQSNNYYIDGAVEDGILFSQGNNIKRYKLSDNKIEEVLNNANVMSISSNGKCFLYKSGSDYGIANVATTQKLFDNKLNLEDLNMKIDPKKEWNEIYVDAWRIFRDFFYVNNIHNVDWNAIKIDYNNLLQSVGSRFDLDFVLSEMISEANAGHSYVDWGDIVKVERIEGGLLGCDLVADKSKNRYKIAKIFKGENWNNERRSPLTEAGVNVKEGDYLVSINGKEITLSDNPYMYLENLANKYIKIGVSHNGSFANLQTFEIKTISSELEIRYYDWVCERRNMVDKLSKGRIGYMHLPNTAIEGNRELHRGMYSFNDKEALIFDDRYNGGGFIPDRMIDLIERRTLTYWHKNLLQPSKAPDIAHDGPKVMLINGYSSSGGDALPYFFKKTKQGKLIGTRTWGGLVGISRNATLVDGGYISVPRFGIFDNNEGWIIEGVGVYPDIEVVERPEFLVDGKDACIEKAVEVLLEELKNKPTEKINSPIPPDRKEWIEIEIK